MISINPIFIWSIATLVFIFVDVLSGIVKALKKRELNSTKMRAGIYNKVAFVLILMLGIACDIVFRYIDLGFSLPILELLCGYIITTEISSIIENVHEINPNIVTDKIYRFFERKE